MTVATAVSASVTGTGGDIVGFAPEEVDFSLPTRAARLKWVVVVNSELPPGRAANAAICVAAPTVAGVPGLLGSPVDDADGATHTPLPWLGCSVLAADPGTLRAIRAKVAAAEGMFLADMPGFAQGINVYTEYQAAVRATAAEDLDYCAISIVGPRNRVGKIVGKLPLLA